MKTVGLDTTTRQVPLVLGIKMNRLACCSTRHPTVHITLSILYYCGKSIIPMQYTLYYTYRDLTVEIVHTGNLSTTYMLLFTSANPLLYPRLLYTPTTPQNIMDIDGLATHGLIVKHLTDGFYEFRLRAEIIAVFPM